MRGGWDMLSNANEVHKLLNNRQKILKFTYLQDFLVH
jgi:hypothetical protein